MSDNHPALRIISIISIIIIRITPTGAFVSFSSPFRGRNRPAHPTSAVATCPSSRHSLWCACCPAVLLCRCCAVPHKLVQLIREKADLETRLETEQEYVVNKLCKQVGAAINTHKEVFAPFPPPSSPQTHTTHTQHTHLRETCRRGEAGAGDGRTCTQ